MLRLMLAAALAAAAAPALAQGANPSAESVQRGKAYARESCSDCHAVEPGVPTPPMAIAPSFTDIAKTPGMTSIALSAWFVTSHPNMPNLIITERRREDLLAYFAALREAAKQAEADH